MLLLVLPASPSLFAEQVATEDRAPSAEFPQSQLRVVSATAPLKVGDKVIGALSKGEWFPILKMEGSWYKVEKEKAVGWVHADHVVVYHPIVRTVDGDTIVIRVNGVDEKVRLIGVDTPETLDPRKPVQYFGREATAFTDKITRGSCGRLEFDQANTATKNRDKYGRLLAYVYVLSGEASHRDAAASPEIFLNAEIIKQGYGHAYTKYPYEQEKAKLFLELEREARTKEVGLWAPEKKPPDASSKPGSEDVAPGLEEEPKPEKKASAPYVGSRNSNIFHRASCSHAGRILPGNLVEFPSAEDALKSGRVPCKVCQPAAEGAKPEPKQSQEPAAEKGKGPTVYITRTGAKYHSAGCGYLRQSSIPIPLADAKARGYTPCSRCNPPQ